MVSKMALLFIASAVRLQKEDSRVVVGIELTDRCSAPRTYIVKVADLSKS